MDNQPTLFNSAFSENRDEENEGTLSFPFGPLYSLRLLHAGEVSLKHNKWVWVNDQPTQPIWSGQSEVVERLLAQQCELCGSTEQIEVHHIRKLADLKPKGGGSLPTWKQKMATRKRKTLIVCRRCHESIQYGRYDGQRLRR